MLRSEKPHGFRKVELAVACSNHWLARTAAEYGNCCCTALCFVCATTLHMKILLSLQDQAVARATQKPGVPDKCVNKSLVKDNANGFVDCEGYFRDLITVALSNLVCTQLICPLTRQHSCSHIHAALMQQHSCSSTYAVAHTTTLFCPSHAAGLVLQLSRSHIYAATFTPQHHAAAFTLHLCSSIHTAARMLQRIHSSIVQHLAHSHIFQ